MIDYINILIGFAIGSFIVALIWFISTRLKPKSKLRATAEEIQKAYTNLEEVAKMLRIFYGIIIEVEEEKKERLKDGKN